MKRELKHHPSTTGGNLVSLLFVHGICNSAWVWQPSFMPYFANAGYDCYALSLRGHGASEGREYIRRFTLADFANDVAWAVREIGRSVVIVGHSLGGAVTQNHIKRGGTAAGVILLNSVPPHGLMRASTVMAARNPRLWTELKKASEHGLSFADAEVLEDALFVDTPSPDLREKLRRFAEDIPETASRQVSGWTPFAPLPWVMPKLLVIGCDEDQYIPASDARLTSIYYGVRSAILTDCGHAVMLENNWRLAADTMAAWLGANFVNRDGQIQH